MIITRRAGLPALWPPSGYDPRGFFSGVSLATRVSFVVDGFNLYFSLKAVSLGDNRAVPPVLPAPCRWLDLRTLCEAQIHLFGKDAKLDKVYYFSALAKLGNM